MNISKVHEFKTEIYEGHISFDQKKILRVLKLMNNIVSREKYMRTSYFKEKNILLHKNFEFLLEQCKLFYNYVAAKNNYKTVSVYSSWFQIYDKGDFHDTHIHDISNRVFHFWNFIFYIKCSKNSSNTIILEPGYPYIDSNSRITIKPMIGRCVAFPGHVPHYVEPNHSGKRIVLSSNVEFKR